MNQSDEIWSKIQLVAQAILDQSKKKNLDMVEDRHAYLGELLAQAKNNQSQE